MRSQHLLHFSRNSPHFTEPRSSLPCSQEPATYRYPSQFNIIDAPPYFYQINCNIILPSTPRSSTWFLSFRFPPHNPLWTRPLPPTCHMCSPSHCDHQKYSSLSSSLRYYVRSPLLLALRHKYVPKHQISPIKHSSIPQCLTTVLQPLPKRVLHRARSSASSFAFNYVRNLL